MAWYEVEYSCGHVERKQLYGKEVDRKSWIDWAKESRVCPDCYKAKKQEEGERLAQEVDGRFDFAELKGSEKQVKWAVSIRAEMVAKIEAERDKAVAKLSKDHPDLDLSEGYEKIESLIDKLTAVDRASWFIDRRKDHVGAILTELDKDDMRSR